MAASKHDGFNYGLIFRKASKKPDISRGSGRKTSKSTVSRPPAALLSSASDNRLLRLYQNGSKSPENQGFPGFLMPKIADTVCPDLKGFGII